MADQLLNEMATDTDYRREVNNLKADLAVLRSDMSNLIHSVLEYTKHEAGTVKDKAREELHVGLEQLAHHYETLKQQGARATQTVQKRVEEHPLQSVLLAVGAGLLLGKLFMSGGDEH